MKKLSAELPSKQLWMNLRNLGVCGKNKYDGFINAEEFNIFSCNSTSNDGSPIADLISCNSDDRFSFCGVSQKEVLDAISSVKSDACGPDLMLPKFLKMILPLVLTYLCHIFNYCLTTSLFPDVWKIATIIPVPKIAKPKCNSDYRPISLLCFLSKSFEKIIYNQLYSYLNNEHLLTKWQSGFRAGHSCETALLKVSSDLYEALDSDNITILSLLDFSKAFNTVNHDILLYKLQSHFKLSSSALMLIKNIISNRTQCTKVGDVISNPITSNCGVPQGSVLGPLLFSLYINDLPSHIKHCNVHLYADDVQIYISRPIGLIEDCVACLNEDLTYINDWSIKNCLTLNPSKSNCLLVYRRDLDTTSLPQVMLGTDALTFSSCVKNLGIYMNNRMSCCDQVKFTLSKIYSGLRMLRFSADSLSWELRRKLVLSLLIPHFTYGRLIYSHLDAICSHKLKIAFNDCIRYVYGLSRNCHISLLENSILGLPLNTYLCSHFITFMHKLIMTNSPDYLYERLQFSISQRKNILILPKFYTKYGERSFFVQIAKVWNTLPLKLRAEQSHHIFRALLKRYLLDNNLRT